MTFSAIQATCSSVSLAVKAAGAKYFLVPPDEYAAAKAHAGRNLQVIKVATLEQALEGKDTVAEGVLNTVSARALAEREGVDMPIVLAVHRILFEGHPPRHAISDLMTRELRAEQD